MERTEFPAENELPHLMSNFDHEVDEATAKKLREDPKLWAAYPAECFYGYCWFEDGQYHCAVMRYHSWRGVYSAKNPKKLMQLLINDYGPL